MDRRVEEARRLERQLVALRWALSAFGAAQIGFAVRDKVDEPAFVVPLGAALVLGLLAGNLLIARAARSAPDARRLGIVGFVAFALDAAAVTGLVWLASDGPSDPVWVVGTLLPLEGAARWGLRGALAGATLFLGGELLRELDLRVREPSAQAGPDVLAFRFAMAFVVGTVAGSFASSLRRQADVADERAREAEAAVARAQAAAERERQARGEVAAFHAAVLATTDKEDVERSLSATAEAIAQELGCGSFGILVRAPGLAGEDAFSALGVHGDPGYLEGQVLSPVSDPVAAAAAEGEPILAGPDVVAPMRVRDEVVGALHERSLAPSEPDQERLTVLSRLADQLGLVLESARLRADQEATVRRLRDLDEMKTDFVAITSHELRTPLSGIRGFVDMVRRRSADLSTAERDEYLDIVLHQTDRLIGLVDDLLVVSRVEAGKLSLAPERTDIRGFLESIARGLGQVAQRVQVKAAPEAPETMLVDPRRLTQILTNLVHNALKFSTDGSLVDLAWSAPVEGTVAFTVTDHGIGIEPGELSRVFDRFHQSERAIAHSEGFGLGLYITKQLVEAMGGWIDVRSEPSVGSTFTVTLPASRSLPAPARPSAARRSD